MRIPSLSIFFKTQKSGQTPSRPHLARHEMFRRIEPEQMAELENRIQALPPLNDEEIAALEKGDYAHPLFENEEWPLYAMSLHAEGLINTNEYSRLMLYHDCMQQKEKPIVLKGKEEILPYKDRLINTFAGFSAPEDFDEFFDALTEEDHIFILDISSKSTFLTEITEDIEERFCFDDQIAVFPPGTLQKLIDTLHPEGGLLINPVNGYSATDDFLPYNRRDVYLPNPFVPHPAKLHRMTVKHQVDIYLHDAYYHVFVDHWNMHRDIWTDFAYFFRQKAEEHKNQGQVDLSEKEMEIYNDVLDRNHAYYLPHFKKHYPSESLVFNKAMKKTMKAFSIPQHYKIEWQKSRQELLKQRKLDLA